MQETPRAIAAHGEAAARDEDLFFQAVFEQEAKLQEILESTDISQRNLAAVIESLEFANDKLQAAMHRIGYLEATVEHLEELAAVIPELKAIAEKCPQLEADNTELKTILIERETQLAYCEAELKETTAVLEQVRASWWCRFWAWLTATSV